MSAVKIEPQTVRFVDGDVEAYLHLYKNGTVGLSDAYLEPPEISLTPALLTAMVNYLQPPFTGILPKPKENPF